MRIGKLRHPVALEQLTSSKDDDGNTVESWVVFEDNDGNGIPAAIEPLSARDLVAAQASQSEVTARITIRWLPGVTGAMRVRRLDDGRVYRIAAPIEDPRSGREYITLPVSQGVSDGH